MPTTSGTATRGTVVVGGRVVVVVVLLLVDVVCASGETGELPQAARTQAAASAAPQAID
jgi:hypothetical protein